MNIWWGGDGGFSPVKWLGDGCFEQIKWNTFTESEPAIWMIPAPGDYTIRFALFKDGAAIDAAVFQLTNLPRPTRLGDAPVESPVTKDKVFLESGGRVVFEAEHFSSRTPGHSHDWLIVPGEDGFEAIGQCRELLGGQK